MKPADKNKTLLSAEEFLEAMDTSNGAQDGFDEFEREAAEGLKMVKDRGARLKKIHDRIDEELKEKKKKRGIVVWFSAAASLVIVAGLIWLILPRLEKKGEVVAANDGKYPSEMAKTSDAALDSIVSVKELNLEADSAKTLVSDLRVKNTESKVNVSNAGAALANEITMDLEDLKQTTNEKIVADRKASPLENTGVSNDGNLNMTTGNTGTNGTTNPGYYRKDINKSTDNANNYGYVSNQTNANTNVGLLSKSATLEESDKGFASMSKKDSQNKDKNVNGGSDTEYKTSKTRAKADTTRFDELALAEKKKSENQQHELEQKKLFESSAKANQNKEEEKTKVVLTSPATTQTNSGESISYNAGTTYNAGASSNQSVSVKTEGLKYSAKNEKEGSKKNESPAKKPVATGNTSAGKKADVNQGDAFAMATDSVSTNSPAFMQEIVLAGNKKAAGAATNGAELNWATPGMPQYPGGFEAMQKFFRDNIKMPADQSKSAGGQVVVSFAIGKDGSVSDVKVVKGIKDCADCTAEVKRVLMLMPKWKPGTNSGKPIEMRYNLPVRF